MSNQFSALQQKIISNQVFDVNTNTSTCRPYLKGISPKINSYMFNPSSLDRAPFNKFEVRAESLSSGFHSGFDTFDRDLDMYHFVSTTISNYTLPFSQSPLNTIRINSPEQNQGRISPSYFLDYNSFNRSSPQKKEQICGLSTPTFNQKSEPEKISTISNPSNFTLEDQLKNLSVNTGNYLNISQSQPCVPPSQNFLEQFIQPTTSTIPSTSILGQGQEIFDNNLVFQTEGVTEQTNDQFNHMSTSQQNGLSLQFFQNEIANGTQLIQDGQVIALNPAQNFVNNFQIPSQVNFGSTQPAFGTCQNQNVIVRVLQNGQFHFISIDASLLQQIIAFNAKQNYEMNVNSNDINSMQVQRPVPTSQQNGFYPSENPNNNLVQKSKEPQPVDLMENPNNWRRLPNNGGYQCNMCNKTYTRKYGLKIHLRIHSGWKPLECFHCKKKFGDPSNMAKHVRLHSTEGSPYKCNLCNKPLVRRRDLERHMRSRHPECPIKPHLEARRLLSKKQ